VLRIDDFTRKKDANLLGGQTGTFTDGSSETLRLAFVESREGGEGHSLELTAEFKASGTYAGYVSSLDNLDLRDYDTLTFRGRGLDAAQGLLVGLKDEDDHEVKLLAANYAGAADADGWCDVQIRLVAFGRALNLSNMDNLSLSFTKDAHTVATILIDDVAFRRSLQSTPIDNFDHVGDVSLLGGPRGTWSEGPAAVGSGYVSSETGRAAWISFGGSIGEGLDGAPGLGYAAWYTGLGGIDCSHCGVLSFRIRGKDGGERPNVYLDDGNHRWGVDIEDYVPVTTEWQTVTIPLADIAEYGVDLTHLERLQFAFEWEAMSGTIYLDEIQFGQAVGSDAQESERALPRVQR
jgi:hypothetical protein